MPSSLLPGIVLCQDPLQSLRLSWTRSLPCRKGSCSHTEDWLPASRQLLPPPGIINERGTLTWLVRLQKLYCFWIHICCKIKYILLIVQLLSCVFIFLYVFFAATYCQIGITPCFCGSKWTAYTYCKLVPLLAVYKFHVAVFCHITIKIIFKASLTTSLVINSP